VKGPGLGLEEKAIEAVKGWKFKPAVGPNGKVVAAMVPIEVTFRLY
jgi:outer membrane biosynthesis protein TonB